MERNTSKLLKVEIISPRGGQIVQGKISIQARANHPEEVNFLDFYIQEPGAKDRYGWKSYSPPYMWGGNGQKLDTTLFDDGPASVVAFCTIKGLPSPGTQSRVHFIINNGKPKVKILSPKDSAAVSGSIPIQVEANDPKGIHKEAGIVAVYIYVDGNLLQKLTKTPYQAVLSICLLAPGLHSIRAVAEDTDSLTSTDTVMVTVAPGASALGNKNLIKPIAIEIIKINWPKTYFHNLRRPNGFVMHQ
jgi:hypothetical protein